MLLQLICNIILGCIHIGVVLKNIRIFSCSLTGWSTGLVLDWAVVLLLVSPFSILSGADALGETASELQSLAYTSTELD